MVDISQTPTPGIRLLYQDIALYVKDFLATLVALHFTPVSDWVSRLVIFLHQRSLELVSTLVFGYDAGNV